MRSSSLMIVVGVVIALVVTNLFTAATTLWLVRRSQPVVMPRFQPQDPSLINAIMSGATDREIEAMLKEGESASVRRSDSAPAIAGALLVGCMRATIEHGAHVLEAVGFDAFKRGVIDATNPRRRRSPAWPYLYKAQSAELASPLQSPSAWDPCPFDGDAAL